MVRKIFDSRSGYLFLLGLNIFAILGIFYISAKIEFPDQEGYWLMAKGISQGKFSSWYFLPIYTPETLRAWGYPFFVYLCQLVHDSTAFVKLMQLLFHFGTLALVLRLIWHFNKSYIFRSIFLFLLLPNLQIAYYAGQVATESLSIFFLVLFFYTWYTQPGHWYKPVWLALIAFVIFQLKPAFLGFPFVIAAYSLFFQHGQRRNNLILVGLFAVLLLPFGCWNKQQHGIFKLTPLEGGAGVAHLGFWAYRLPAGYHPDFYWDSRFSTDLTQPNFVKESKKKQYVKEYEVEWNYVNKELRPLLTAQDSARLPMMDSSSVRLFPVYNGAYTNAREKILNRLLKKHISSSPGYYIQTRIYTAARIWFTGINKEELQKASFMGKLKLLYPFLVTFTCIFGGLITVLILLFKRILSWKIYWPLFLLIGYFGLIHIPFAIQARYTVPVHMFILFLLSAGLATLAVDKTVKA